MIDARSSSSSSSNSQYNLDVTDGAQANRSHRFTLSCLQECQSVAR